MSIKINLNLLRTTGAALPEKVAGYVFDRGGKPIGHGLIIDSNGEVELDLPTRGDVRLFVGPVPEDGRPLSIEELKRLGAMERRVRLPLRDPVRLEVAEPVWRRWLLCMSVVMGRVVKREEHPDGGVREHPICNARVTICEVDPVPTFILRLPDPELLRLRDTLVAELDTGRLSEPSPRFGARLRATTEPRLLRETFTTESNWLGESLRLWPYPLWRWWYRKSCFLTAYTDSKGEFVKPFLHPCSDKPDLYFKVEQQIGGSWVTIHEPPTLAGTHWNYVSGTQVVVEVDNPAAQPCFVPDDINPGQINDWVLPFGVGGMYMLGVGGATPQGDKPGWIYPSGGACYSGGPTNAVTDAPFGADLGFRLDHSPSIPAAEGSPGIKYYRFSYRKGASGDWTHMTAPVVRHYVRSVPQPSGPPKISYPTMTMGPMAVGSEENLYRFRPQDPPAAPQGVHHDWPVNVSHSSDFYSAFLNTEALGDPKSTAGTYQIRLEVFDQAGTQVSPDSGTGGGAGNGSFAFLVPTDYLNGTLETRAAVAGQPGHSDLSGDAFVFELKIDANRCKASIDQPKIGNNEANNCGFLEYPLLIPVNDPTKVLVAFNATHENNEAFFSMHLYRGKSGVINSATGEVTTSVGSYQAQGNGRFEGEILVGDMLSGCPSAAFSGRLYVSAKATNGWQRLDRYDAQAVLPFALAPHTP